MAYHAFANVILFRRACAAQGVDDGRSWRENEPALLADLEVLDAPLRSSSALTVLGRALYEPLRERVLEA
jgi:hypothetical protein